MLEILLGWHTGLLSHSAVAENQRAKTEKGAILYRELKNCQPHSIPLSTAIGD